MPDAIQVRDLITFLQTLDPEYRIKVDHKYPLLKADDVFHRESDYVNLSPLDAAQENLREGLQVVRDEVHDAIKKFEGLTLSELLEGADNLQSDITEALDAFEDEYLNP